VSSCNTTPRALVGNSIKSTLRLLVDNVPTDPLTLRLVVRDPSGNESAETTTLPTLPTTPGAVTQVSTGVFEVSVATDEAGVWWVRWAATFSGGASAADEDFFEALASEFDTP
jgi:hypothetical protein